MKDAILKGTGDSRYLKSKVPTGTTWEQALAMLNAGTFPVDLNGINSEGFQQLGTPLNKTNILKDAVSTKLGLVGDKTPNDMFGVLADCGNLHVWRKTVVTTEEIPAVPAGYTLEDLGTIRLYQVLSSLEYFFVRKTSSVSVSNDGVLSFALESNYTRYDLRNTGDDYGFCDAIVSRAGQIVQFSTQDGYSAHLAEVARDTVLYVSDGVSATYSQIDGYYWITISGLKKLVPYPYTPAIPAGTTTTYPVSTNRNAYQESNNAKPAGYVLGDEETGPFDLCDTTDSSFLWEYSDSVDVSDTGAISLHSPTKIGIYRGSAASVPAALIGKFFASRMTGINNFDNGVIYFAPSDATISQVNPTGSSYYKYQLSKRQPVTGYPAIPASTTIDYLGNLGDKAKVQVLSFVGTGTSNASTPCSATFDFVPKIVFLYSASFPVGSYSVAAVAYAFFCSLLSSEYTTDMFGFNSSSDIYVKIDGKTLSWYQSSNSGINRSGRTAYVLAIG